MKSNSTDTRTTDPKGSVDDADVTAEVAGMKVANFGLAIDSIGRTTPTHMIPLYVRQMLSQFFEGTIPWYDSEPATTTVASELAVTNMEAEAFGQGNEGAANVWLNYTDVPLNTMTNNRLSYWRYDRDSIEFDDSMNFESQVYAVDCFSQLFTECFDFHFAYLAELDAEYHRLRSEGPLGIQDDSSETTAWHNMYHYWRERVSETYLDSGLIILPTGLANANWTIQDVLDEIVIMMVDNDGMFRPDIYITTKGATFAKGGATLGIKTDPAYADNDGNPRFYMPAWDVISCYTDDSAFTQPGQWDGNRWAYGYNWSQHDITSEAAFLNTYSETTHGGDADISSASYRDVNARSMFPVYEWLEQLGRLPLDYAADQSSAYYTLVSQQPDHYLSTVPWGDGNTTPGLLADAFAYWRGYQLNLVEMIQAARLLGRQLEPEVSQGFLPEFGLVASPLQLLDGPSALTSREYDDLFNLYESSYTYRDNPIRTYSAAHLGPIDETIFGLDIGGVMIDSYLNGAPLTVRERYWTPERIDTAEDVSHVLTYFLPNVTLEGTMLGNVDLQGVALAGGPETQLSYWVDRGLVSRMLGGPGAGSMLTKVEKPIILHAGLSSEEGAYASGLGVGSVELVMEMLYSALAGEPVFGLGHNGFIDWHTTQNPAVADGEGGSGDYYPRSRLEACQELNPPMVVFHEYSKNRENGILTALVANSLASASDEFANLAMERVEAVYDEYDSLTQNIISELPSAIIPTYVFDDIKTFSNMMGSMTAVAHTNDAIGAFQTVQHSPYDATSIWGYAAYDERVEAASAEKDHFAGANQYLPDGEAAISLVPWQVTFVNGNVDPGDPLAEYTVDLGIIDHPHTGNKWEHTMATDAHMDLMFKTTSEYEIGWTEPETAGLPNGNAFEAVYDIPVIIPENVGSYNSSSNPWAVGSATTRYNMPSGQTVLYANPIPTPLDIILSAFQTILESYPEFVESLISGDQEFEVSLDCDLVMREHGNWTQTGSGATQTLTLINVTKYNYMLTWDHYARTSGVPGEWAFECGRTQMAGEDRTRQGEVTSDSRVRLWTVGVLPALSTAEIDAIPAAYNYGEDTLLTAGESITLTPPAAPLDLGNDPGVLNSEIYSLIGVASNPVFTPSGSWLNPHFQSSTTVTSREFVSQSVNPANILPVIDLVKDPTQPGVPANQDVDATWLTAQFTVPGMTHAGFNSMPYILTTASYEVPHGNWAHGGGRGYTLGSTPWLRAPARDLSSGKVMAGSSQDSATYIIPDDPDKRMVYRPYRRLVDAALSREVKMLFMPTHENYSAEGGALGLPVYGRPSLFRFAQMVFDANLPDQFALEKATSKTRLVNKDNRGLLTFSKATLLDETTLRHILPDVVKGINDLQFSRGGVHSASASGQKVYTKELIRDVQLGRQYQRLGL